MNASVWYIGITKDKSLNEITCRIKQTFLTFNHELSTKITDLLERVFKYITNEMVVLLAGIIKSLNLGLV